MATHEQQVKLKELDERIHLYKTRITDAQQKNRPDIEKIWVAELKIVEEKRQTLKEQIANNSNSETETSPAPNSSNTERQLRQIDNQIAYIKKKITIHQERGETAAITKQTALLRDLEQQRKKFLPAPPPLPNSTSSTPRTIKRLNAEIAHANKMIAEYKKFNSPKANEWIGKKFQLEAQRDRLLAEQPAPTPPPLPTTRPPAAAIIDTAIDINKQIRVIDLELAHADKMIREYQKYHSPKVNQWIQRKNELLARRARITGNVTPSVTNPANDIDVQRRLKVILLELAHADKMIREYQKYNSPKAQEWINKRNDLLAERAFLQGHDAPQPQAQPQPVDREAIKARIVDYNKQAQNADKLMRIELQRGNHQQAIVYKEQRDFFNLEVKKLTASLNITPTTPTVTPSQPQPHTPEPDGTNQPSIGNPSAQERNIANRYLHDRNYSHEHTYRDVISLLTQQPKYQYLAHAKETLFDITQASQLPPKGTTINMAFVRDCFKIRTSNIQLEGYTINDTIFNTSFPEDFDKSIDRINTLVSPAPALKHYSLLAHRDAIQLIPVDRNISRHNSQYAGAKLSNISIRNININSKGPLQGLFASDGCFENIHIENIHVQTASQHQIAILGMLSGTLSLSSNGQPIHVNLLPLRLGGGRNIYINSFSSNSSYQYGQVSSGNSNAVIQDNRLQMNKRGRYYQDFNMEDFFASLRRADPNIHILDQIESAVETAGRLVKEV